MSLQNKLMKANYHTHIELCRHAVGDVEDYVKEALEHNFLEIGISDHAPVEYFKDRSVRMFADEYDLYLSKIDECIEKYSDKIKILKGFEIEYVKDLDINYEKMLKDVDYLILGQHYIYDEKHHTKYQSTFGLKHKKHIESYAKSVVDALETGYFSIIAHPDIMFHGYFDWNETTKKASIDIIEKAKELNIPLELNANGFRRGKVKTPQGIRYRYPRIEFWELVSKYQAEVIIGSDCHDPKLLFDEYVEIAYQFAEKLKLNVIDFLKL